MAKIKAAKTKKGYDELKQVVGSAPPIEINVLSADELQKLTELVGGAIDRHEAAMVEAEENVINFAPRMMRGSVRRLLGAGR
jgi:hypothetical protein